jgi:hypothetical protein
MSKTRWLEHEEPSNEDVRNEVLRLLMLLKAGESICPTEAARAFGPRWRQYQPMVREVITDMVRDELIEVTQNGVVIDVEERDLDTIRGPVRLQLPRQKAVDD